MIGLSPNFCGQSSLVGNFHQLAIPHGEFCTVNFPRKLEVGMRFTLSTQVLSGLTYGTTNSVECHFKSDNI